ncbi:hypothetical protein [Floridanema evergladense]|uniref:Uncharacterized protein n=1 Tax=Floridaenema evergladense BLCC-F167 TaxID=3153639 RepID=A0ABV4WD01_9CYAN
MPHCPTCTCQNCQEQTIWQREKHSLDSYPGSHKPAAKNIHKVTRQSGGDSYYVDLGTTTPTRPKTEPRKQPEPIKRSPNQPNQKPGKPKQSHSQLPTTTTPCPTSGKPSTLTPDQRQQIIKICQQNPQDEEIGGFLEVMPDGSTRITQEPNLAPKNERHNSFGFSIDPSKRKVIGVWHRHVRRMGHDRKLSIPDIDAAKRTGLSSYVVWDVGEKGKRIPDEAYQWDEFHPNGTPNQTPTRAYKISFTCPTAEQIMQKQKEGVGWIQEDNQKLKQKIEEADKEIKAKQREVMVVATRSLTTSTNAKTKSDAIAMRLNLAKQLPEGDTNGTIRMGRKPEQQPIHAGQRNNTDAGNQYQRHCLPVGRGTPAESTRDRRVIEKSWLD